MPEEYYEEDLAPRRRPKSGAVTAVAIVNFVLGGLCLVCGLISMMGGAFLAQLGGAAGQEIQKQMPPDVAADQARLAAAVGGGLGMLVMIVAVVLLLEGALMIVAGVGVVQRKSWGRILSLVIAGLAVVLAVIGLWQRDWGTVVLNLIYAGLVFAILLPKDKAAEFS